MKSQDRKLNDVQNKNFFSNQKLLKVLIYILILFIAFLVFASFDSPIKASAAEFNLISGYSDVNFSLSSVGSATTVSAVDQTISTPVGTNNRGLYWTSGSPDIKMDAEIETTRPEATYAFVVYYRFILSDSILSAMKAGNISSINVTADPAKARVPGYLFNGGNMSVQAFAALTPEMQSSGLLNSAIQAGSIAFSSTKHTATIKKGNDLTASANFTFSNALNYDTKKEIVVGYVIRFDKNKNAKPKLVADSFKSASITVSYQAPKVKFEDIDGGLKNMGLAYDVSGLSDSDKELLFSNDGLTIGFATNFTVTIKTLWNNTLDEFYLFRKYDYSYEVTNPSDHFQKTYVSQSQPGLVKMPSHSEGVISLNFNASNTTAGKHIVDHEVVKVKIEWSGVGTSNQTQFLYKQDEDFNDVGQAPSIYVYENGENNENGRKKIVRDPTAADSTLFKFSRNPYYSGQQSEPEPPSNVGTYRVYSNIIYRAGNGLEALAGPILLNFSIAPVSLTSQGNFNRDSLDSFSFTYSGEEHRPDPGEMIFEFRDTSRPEGDRERIYKLKRNVDYLPSAYVYSNNINASFDDSSERPTLKITGNGNFTGSAEAFFRIDPMDVTVINSYGQEEVLFTQVGDREGEQDSKKVSLEIAAFHDTQMYSRDVEGSDFPKPNVSYLRFGWSSYAIGLSDKSAAEGGYPDAAMEKRFFFINRKFYDDDRQNSSASFGTGITYNGVYYDKYRVESGAINNDPLDPETSPNWVVAAEYEIDYTSYKCEQDNTAKKIYGSFKINFVKGSNFIGELRVRYEIIPRNLNAAKVEVAKYTDGERIYNANGQPHLVLPYEIKVYDEVQVWEPVYNEYDQSKIDKYVPHPYSRVYIFARNSYQGGEIYDGYFDDAEGSYRDNIGTNINVRDNLENPINRGWVGSIYFGLGYKNEIPPLNSPGNYMIFQVHENEGLGMNKFNFMFRGQIRLCFDISPKPFSNATKIGTEGNIPLAPKDVIYNGAELEIPSIYVEDDGYQLNKNSNYLDYEFSYSNNKDVSFDENGNIMASAEVTITGIGNYSGTARQNFKILRRTLQNEYLAAIHLPAETYTGQTIIPQIDEFNITFISGTIPREPGFDHDRPDALQSKTFVISNIYRPSDPDDPDYDPEWPNGNIKPQFEVLEGIGNSGTNQDAGTEGNWVNIRIINGNFQGVIKASFEILPLDISVEGVPITGQTSWSSIGAYFNQVTYTGSQIARLPIVANQSQGNTIAVSIHYGGTSKILQYGSISSACDYYITENSWGTNINAGDGYKRDSDGNKIPRKDGDGNILHDFLGNVLYEEDENTGGRVTIYGKGNYTGSFVLKFEIVPRDINRDNEYEVKIDDSPESGFLNDGYTYTGLPINPEVESVHSTFGNSTKLLVRDVDYVVDYNDFAEDIYNNGYNVSVLRGGKIAVKGIGNYTGKYIHTFKINPREQTVNLLIAESSDNPDLKIETKATSRADFEINADSPGYIIVKGKTDAIYPTPRKVKFRMVNSQGLPSDLVTHEVIYLSIDIVDGFAITTAQINFVPGKYGVVRIIAEQEDGLAKNIDTDIGRIEDGFVGVNPYFQYGNYKPVSQSEGSLVESKRIYLKRQDSADRLVPLSKMYGDQNFEIRPNLNSQRFGNTNFNIEISNTDILDFESYIQGAEVYRFKILSHGIVTIKLSHDGFIHGTDIDKAYVSFEKTVEVNIAKRDLFIMFGGFKISPTDIETLSTFEYGFYRQSNGVCYSSVSDGVLLHPVYLYKTLINGRLNEGLAYNDRPEDVFEQGLTFDGVNDEIPNVGTIEIDVRVPSGYQGGKYANYNIMNVPGAQGAENYQKGKIKIVKKELTPYVKLRSSGNPVSQLEKTYGENSEDIDSSKYQIDYRGFVENADNAITTPSFIIRSYRTLGVEGPHTAVNQHLSVNAPSYASANEYNIKKFSSVGTYLVYLSEGEAQNYIIKKTTIPYVITKASVNITFGMGGEGNNKYLMQQPYNGGEIDLSKQQYFNQSGIEVTGLEGGSTPMDSSSIERFSFRYVHDGQSDGGKLVRPPANAGKHRVEITFTADINDNYKTTTVEMPELDQYFILEITKVAPVIVMNEISVQYKEESLTLSDLGVGAQIFGIPGGSTPNPEIIEPSNYQFRVHGAASYTTEWPTDMNTYDVKITYTASSVSNYIDLTKEFENILVITPKDVYITAESREFVYRSSMWPYPSSGIKGYKSSAYDEEIEPKGSNGIHIEYQKDGAVVSQPIDAGVYDVIITFDPDNNNYRPTTKAFPGLLRIRQFDLFQDNHDTALQYNGVKVVDYDGYSKAFLREEIKLLKPEDHLPPRECNYVAYYVPVGSATPVLAPRNAGTYKLVIKYEQRENDNYTMSQDIEYENVLVINQINPKVTSYQKKETPFTGSGASFPVSLIGETYNDGGILKTDTLKGNIVLYYKNVNQSQSEYSRTLPIYPGSYDVKVTYMPETADNYQSFEYEIFDILTITKVRPTLQLRVEGFASSTITVDYENRDIIKEIMKVIAIGRGQSVPKIDNEQGPGMAITITYRKGSSIISSDEIKDAESGEYEILAAYQAPSNETIYTNVPQMKIDGRLIIRNVKPILSLENLNVTYNGFAITPNVALITNLEGRQAKGTLVYKYRKSNEIEYTLERPVMAGEYDVQVEYRAKQGDDNFSSATVIFRNAIIINALDIEVEAIYGQGKTFDGIRADEKSLLYYYSYEQDGIKIFNYSDARNAKDDKYDLSQSLYYAENGVGYVIDTASKMAFADYEVFKVLPKTYSFIYDSTDGIRGLDSITANSNEPVYEAYSRESRRLFTVDTINMVVYTNNESIDYYPLNKVNGYFFSLLDNNGYSYTVRINPSNISPTGDYKVVIGGLQRTFKVNLDQMEVKTPNLQTTYKIFESAGEIRKPLNNGAYETLYFNYENDVTKGDSKTPMFMLFASDGFVYNILPNSNKTKRMFRLSIKDLSFTTNDGVEHNFENTDLEKIYGENIYKKEIDGKTYIIDLLRCYARVEKTNKYQVDGEYIILPFGLGSISLSQLVALPYQPFYLYSDTVLGVDYIINTDNQNVYVKTEVGLLNTANNKIEFESGDEVNVDYETLVYKLYKGTTIVDEDTLFNKKLYVKAPALLNTKDRFYLGGIYVSEDGAGVHNINISGMDAGDNYNVIPVIGTKYRINKAVVFVVFNPDEFLVYDGMEKSIDFEYLGEVARDDYKIKVSQSLTSYEGDRINATEGLGFRLLIELTNPNYFIMLEASPWYQIEKAMFAEYGQEKKEVVYTGNGYFLNITGLDSSYTISYVGYEGTPTFTEPGEYTVEAIISKPNYYDQSVVIEMKINRALFDIEPDPINRTLYYGEKMPTLTSSTELGTFMFASGLSLDPRVTTYEWVFVPNDSDLFYSRYVGLAENNYVVKGKMELTVEKAPAKIAVKGSLNQSLNNPEVITPIIDGKMVASEDVIITYQSADGEIFTKMPTQAGRYTVNIKYLGDETHSATEYQTELVIKDEVKLNWVWITLGVLVGLGALSSMFFVIRKKKKYK